MAARRLFGNSDTAEGEAEGAPLGGTRAEAIQRLQVGVFGLFSMVLVVGVANIVYVRAQATDAAAVPDAAPTTEPTEIAPQSDPLADAGVVPDIPVEPEPEEETEAGIEENAVPDIEPGEDSEAVTGDEAPTQ